MTKLSSTAAQLIGIGVGTVVIVGIALIFFYSTRKRSGVIVSPATHVKPPPVPPGAYVPTAEAKQCLPALQTCTTQLECNGCVERPGNELMECTSVQSGGDAGVVDPATGKLRTPRIVDVALTAGNLHNCSGHGKSIKYGRAYKCVCDGDPNKDDVWYDGDVCNMQHIRVDIPGNYCLPAYENKCDVATSDTVLTVNSSGGHEWTCQCKSGYNQMFQQPAEGTSCSVQTACGAQQPQLDAHGNPKLFRVYNGKQDAKGVPIFTKQPVHPNRLVSYNSQSHTNCMVPTTRTSVSTGNNQKYVEITPAADADPTCTPVQHSNKCSVLLGTAGVVTTIRGSGRPGDPLLQRVSPAYAPPVPPGMQQCPDGWGGAGTRHSPCTSPDYDSVALYADNRRDWIGGAINSIDDVRGMELTTKGKSVGKTLAQLAWKSVNPTKNYDVVLQDPICREEASLAGTPFDPASDTGYPIDTSFCVDSKCTAAYGRSAAAWNVHQDGDILDDAGMPSFVTNGAYGAHCACDAFSVDGVAERPAYSLPGGNDNEPAWWSCVSDSCSSKESPGGKFDATTKQCSCPSVSSKDTPPFTSSIPWTPEHQPPRCIRDPCNPGGTSTHKSDIAGQHVSCNSDSACAKKSVCYNNTCHIKTTGIKCKNDDMCRQKEDALAGTAVCYNGECLYEDIERKEAGTTCECEDGEACVACAMGKTCDLATQTCSSYCMCAKGYEQVVDITVPGGYKCVDKCDPNPCQNGGTCSVDSKGIRTCTCEACYGGALCESFEKNPDRQPGSKCKSDKDCCTGYCHTDTRGSAFCTQRELMK